MAAAVGFSGLSVAPATAMPFIFDNCTQAAQYGVYNIPAGMVGYGPHLDSDNDGVGCENASVAFNPDLVPQESVDDVLRDPLPPGVVEFPQVEQMPVGGADTGVAQESTRSTDVLVLGGGLALMAAVGGAYLVRRRAA